MSEKRPILVAGSTGQLARCLKELACKRGLPLVARGRPDFNIESAKSIAGVVAAVRPGLIINAAGYTAVDKAESDPEHAFTINREGAGWLAAAAAASQIPYIYVSSDYVFDGRKPSPYLEEDTPSPLSVYGRSKLEGEAAVRAAYPAAMVLRTSWIYSPFGNNFVKTMLRLGESREVVRVVDDQHGAPTAASDLASAVLEISQRMLADPCEGQGEIYHLTARGNTTWHGFASEIFAGWKGRGRRVPVLKPITTADYPLAAQRPANSRLDCTKIERALGIRLPHWHESIGACLDSLAAGTQS